MIPHILHQIWIGPKPFPDEFAAYQQTWRDHHPEWELRMWTEANLPDDLRRPEARERLRVPAERSDILRLEVLWRHGGVYLDTDFECLRPIDELIAGTDFLVADLKPGQLNNAIIGAVPGHRILDHALDVIRPREFNGYDKEATGPLFLNHLLRDRSQITVLEPPVFYPKTPEERERAVAIHHGARSWKDAEGFRTATLVAEDRLAQTQRRLSLAEADVARLRAQLGREERLRRLTRRVRLRISDARRRLADRRR